MTIKNCVVWGNCTCLFSPYVINLCICMCAYMYIIFLIIDAGLMQDTALARILLKKW